jgi:hypothetical protein
VIRAAALALPLAMLASPASAKPIAPGVYGNVSYSPESGDLGGIELELLGTGGQARVEFVFCEGWCGPSHSQPVTLTDDGFSFDYVEEYVDEQGRPAPSQRMHVEVRRAGSGLKVAVTPSATGAQATSMTLKPLKARYGLAVADRD